MADSKVYREDTCTICLQNLESEAFVTLTQKGLNKVHQSSLECGDVSLYEYLTAGPGCVKIHVTCRRDYTNQKRISVLRTDASEFTHDGPVKKLRSLCNFFPVEN